MNREIDLAIDRQSEYRPPSRFVIPAFIDDPANALELLDRWQSVDLTHGRRRAGADDPARSGQALTGAPDDDARRRRRSRRRSRRARPRATATRARHRSRTPRWTGELFRGRAGRRTSSSSSILSSNLLVLYSVSGLGKTLAAERRRDAPPARAWPLARVRAAQRPLDADRRAIRRADRGRGAGRSVGRAACTTRPRRRTPPRSEPLGRARVAGDLAPQRPPATRRRARPVRGAVHARLARGRSARSSSPSSARCCAASASTPADDDGPDEAPAAPTREVRGGHPGGFARGARGAVARCAADHATTASGSSRCAPTRPKRRSANRPCSRTPGSAAGGSGTPRRPPR